MNPILDAVTTFLEADDWPITPIAGDTAYSMTFVGESGRWPCIAQAVEESRLFIFYSACPLMVPTSKVAAVVEFITRVNFGLRFGNFELDYEDGHIRCRTNVAVTEFHDLPPSMVSQVVYENVMLMDTYLPGLKAVIEQGMSPLAAIATAENQAFSDS